MTKEECFNLGYISRRVGNFGELAFTLDVDDPQRYRKLESVFLERNGSLIPFFIKKISVKGNIATVSLEGVDNITAAEELVRSGLFLPLSYLPPMKGKKFYFHELPGFTAYDENFGELGIVSGVLDFPQQAIIQIRRELQEILIPAKDDFIVKIDRVNKEIWFHAPEGLIDIYLGNSKDEAEDKESDEDNP